MKNNEIAIIKAKKDSEKMIDLYNDYINRFYENFYVSQNKIKPYSFIEFIKIQVVKCSKCGEWNDDYYINEIDNELVCESCRGDL
jgi:formylmethanofuran dehydrogenase subunit E